MKMSHSSSFSSLLSFIAARIDELLRTIVDALPDGVPPSIVSTVLTQVDLVVATYPPLALETNSLLDYLATRNFYGSGDRVPRAAFLAVFQYGFDRRGSGIVHQMIRDMLDEMSRSNAEQQRREIALAAEDSLPVEMVEVGENASLGGSLSSRETRGTHGNLSTDKESTDDSSNSQNQQRAGQASF